MATGVLAPVAIQQFFDANGDPLVGGLVQWYLAGSSTPSPVYADPALLNVLPNPVVLDAAGRAPQMFLQPISYRMVLKTAAGVTIWTADNIYDPLAPGNVVMNPATGPILFTPDNTHDIGAAGASRPRDIYVGRDIRAGRDVLATRDVAAGGNVTGAAIGTVGNVSGGAAGFTGNLTVGVDASIGRDLTVARLFTNNGVNAYQGRIHIPLAGGTLHNWLPAGGAYAAEWQLAPTTLLTITGILAPSPIIYGTQHLLVNASGVVITFANANAGSSFPNQIIGPRYSNFTLSSWESAVFTYSSAPGGCWIVIGK